ncbi:MAG: deoxyribonuclease V [Dehalococcoidia bacterium]|nr:deoxyribonuclease V [Dehalococcoidia bacterium]
MELRRLHEWNLTFDEAREVQLDLAGKVCRRNEVNAPRLVAGIDARYDGSRGLATGAVVVLSFPDLKMLEVRVSHCVPTFPYVPGLLSFREIPVIMEACRKVVLTPDLIFVDGQGIAHPRRFGLASHAGLLLDRPSIGCAKSRLIGEYEAPGPEKGSMSDLKDDGEVIGAVLRTKAGTKPVYVSVGHNVDLAAATHWSLACCTRYRLPDPARLAHLAASGSIGEKGPDNNRDKH